MSHVLLVSFWECEQVMAIERPEGAKGKLSQQLPAPEGTSRNMLNDLRGKSKETSHQDGETPISSHSSDPFNTETSRTNRKTRN